MPKRIQMSRQNPWRADNPDAVIVARPSKWGNPYSIDDLRKRFATVDETYADAELRSLVVTMFRADLTHGPDSPFWWYGPHLQFITIKAGIQAGELAGKDLACWCPLPEPGEPDLCHADVLLSIANPELNR